MMVMGSKVPKGWKKYRLGDIGKILTGSTPSKRQPENYGGVLPWIKPPNLDRDIFVTTSEETISDTGRYKVRLLLKNSVMVSCIGNIGKVGIAGCELCTNQQINSIVPDHKIVDSIFLYYLMNRIRPLLEKKASKAVVPILNKNNFSNIEIALPSITTQKKIASILELVRKTIKLKQETYEYNNDFLKSVFFHMFGDPANNKKKWSVSKIANLVEFSQYGTSKKSNNSKKGYIVLGMNCILYDGRLDLSDYNHVDLSENEFKVLKLNKGDILFNRTNSTELVGKTAVWDLDIDATFASYLVKIKLNKTMNPHFFSFLLNAPYYKKLFQVRCRKAVNQSNISPTLLKEFSVITPPIELQNRFANITGQIEINRKSQEESKKEINNLFDSLIQKAFTGKLVA